MMADVFVEAMGENLGLNFGGYFSDGQIKGEIEVFVSKKGHVTNWHFDYMENFTFQLKGRCDFFFFSFYHVHFNLLISKKWKLKSSGITHPLRGCTPHYKQAENVEEQQKSHQLHDKHFQFDENQFGDAEEVTLEPGSGINSVPKNRSDFFFVLKRKVVIL